MGRIGRSFQLVGQSYRVLMQDKELMILPLISGTVIAIVVASFAFGFGIDQTRVVEHGPDIYLPVFLMYVFTYAVGIFFQAAIVAGATERMAGGDPTLGSALAAAARRLPSILMWACIAATVGMLLRAIQDRAGFVGKIVVALIGAAWSLATFFVVPVLVVEQASAAEALPLSMETFKRTWGETVVGGTSLGAAAVCAWLTLVALTGLLAYAVGPWALVLFFLGAIALMVFFSALQGVFVASLYRYATTADRNSTGFDAGLLAQAFVPRRR
jgi:hypothetical protein